MLFDWFTVGAQALNFLILVLRFNDVVADHAVTTLAAPPPTPKVWPVGERVHARLTDAGLAPVGLFTVPNSVIDEELFDVVSGFETLSVERGFGCG